MEWGSIIVQVIVVAVGVTVGIVAGTRITLRSSRRASEELRREAGELRHYIDVLAGFLESLELDPRISVGHDETGRITNVRVQSSAASYVRGSSGASGTLQHRQDQDRDVEGAEEG